MSYSVAANSPGARRGTIVIASETVTVNQAAIPSLSIGDATVTEGDSGTKTLTVDVTVSP